ncbi:hypothetical protein LSAT2_020535 [Lamellibrachia satsuma]|nr:hypothetical protein LSAT2_020535 [Lamellibrachia satsuma]
MEIETNNGPASKGCADVSYLAFGNSLISDSPFVDYPSKRMPVSKTETVISPLPMSSGKTLTFASPPDLRLKMPPPERCCQKRHSHPCIEGINTVPEISLTCPNGSHFSNLSWDGMCSECASGRRESTSSPTPSPTPDLEGLSTPDTGSVKDGGFYVLRKDGERRSTLVKALVEDEDAICLRWLNFLHRDTNGPTLKLEHLHMLMVAFRDFIHDQQNKKAIQNVFDDLREMIDFTEAVLSELKLAVYLFHDSVSETLKQQHIEPHWMFALDNQLRDAIRSAIDLCPALLGGGNLDGLPNAEQEEESTSGVSTYDSTRREHECAHYDNRELYGQLQNIEEENRRLLERLISSQQTYQKMLQRALEEKQLHTQHLRQQQYKSPVKQQRSIISLPLLLLVCYTHHKYRSRIFAMPKRKAYTVREKLDLVIRIRKGESQCKVSREMRVPESTLRGWLKDEVKL